MIAELVIFAVALSVLGSLVIATIGEWFGPGWAGQKPRERAWAVLRSTRTMLVLTAVGGGSLLIVVGFQAALGPQLQRWAATDVALWYRGIRDVHDDTCGLVPLWSTAQAFEVCAAKQQVAGRDGDPCGTTCEGVATWIEQDTRVLLEGGRVHVLEGVDDGREGWVPDRVVRPPRRR